MFGGYPWRYLTDFKIKNFDDFIFKYYQLWQRLISDDKRKIFLILFGMR